MTRFLAILSCLILVLGLCIGVSAAEANGTRAYSVNVFATVSSDGSCDVTTTVTLHVDAPQTKLVYPVPVNASNVALNGSPVLTEKTEQARLVDLTKTLGGMSGDFSFTVTYSIHSAVHSVASEKAPAEGTAQPTSRKLQLELPMLSGFAYPIDQFQFSVNVPGMVNQNPSFISGYHQANIEKDLTYSYSGGNIAGRSWGALKDHETLNMYLDTTDEMFPQTRADLPDMEGVTVLIGVFAGLALLYWIFFLRNYLPIMEYPPVAPEGFGAGQLGTVLTAAGADLHLMLFSWAQLGYVILRMDRRGKVFVLKRMDMGNERTAFEQKWFYQLFSRRDMIDTTSMAYQRMVQAVSLQKPAAQLFRSRGTGKVKLFRGLMAIAGLLSGTCFGILLGNMLDYGWVFMLVLSAVGLICSWHIQFWAEGLFLHHRSRIYVAVVLCLLWLALGIAIGQIGLALLAVAIQIVAGFLATFGGRRTEEGRMAMGQVLSLRRYLRKLSPKQLQQLCRENPDAFFDLAPYAMALGSDRILARHFGKSRLPVCPYIQAANTRGLTAQQWSQLMRTILDGMTARQRKMPLEALRAVMDNYMR